MSSSETPESIARDRAVTAAAILENRVDLRSYPYRYLAVICRTGFGVGPVTPALVVAEVLDRAGWDLVNISEFTANRTAYAIMRRR